MWPNTLLRTVKIPRPSSPYKLSKKMFNFVTNIRINYKCNSSTFNWNQLYTSNSQQV
jgi:hypothetical protein